MASSAQQLHAPASAGSPRAGKRGPQSVAATCAAGPGGATRILAGVRGLLLDLDGVMYDADEPVAGAVETFHYIRERALPYLFVTNATSRPRSALVAKLAGMGVETDADHILTPAVAAATWLRTQPEGPVALFVRPAARVAFEGLARLPGHAESGARYVVLGDLGDGWTYPVLNRAFRLLDEDAGVRLVALGMTRYWQADDGVSLDVAPFVRALEHATDRQAIVLGKPSPDFFAAALDCLGLEAQHVTMVGDDVRTDVRAAQACGLRGVLVRTGKFRAADLDSGVSPDGVLDSIADLPRWLA